jgi:hypothetical protein
VVGGIAKAGAKGSRLTEEAAKAAKAEGAIEEDAAAADGADGLQAEAQAHALLQQDAVAAGLEGAAACGGEDCLPGERRAGANGFKPTGRDARDIHHALNAR